MTDQPCAPNDEPTLTGGEVYAAAQEAEPWPTGPVLGTGLESAIAAGLLDGTAVVRGVPAVARLGPPPDADAIREALERFAAGVAERSVPASPRDAAEAHRDALEALATDDPELAAQREQRRQALAARIAEQHAQFAARQAAVDGCTGHAWTLRLDHGDAGLSCLYCPADEDDLTGSGATSDYLQADLPVLVDVDTDGTVRLEPAARATADTYGEAYPTAYGDGGTAAAVRAALDGAAGELRRQATVARQARYGKHPSIAKRTHDAALTWAAGLVARLAAGGKP